MKSYPSSACEGKETHASFADAKRIARDMREKYGEMLLAYACPHCGKYHVGHTPIKQLKSYKKRAAKNDRYALV